MKYLWIGVCLSDEQREFIINGGGKILSANVSQDALLAGLEQMSEFLSRRITDKSLLMQQRGYTLTLQR